MSSDRCCEIPASFAIVEAWAHEQMALAQEAIRAGQRRRHELDELTAALTRATAAFEPHRAALTAAERASRHARDAVAHAKRRLDNSRLRDRRSARNELTAAEQALATATDDLNRIVPTAGPLRDQYVDALTRHEAAHRVTVPAEILDRWGHYPARVNELEQLLDALGTWQQWARGHDVPAHQLADSAVVISHAAVDRSYQPLLAEIATTVDGWATSAQLHLRPASPGTQRSTPGPSVGLGIEL